MAKRARKFDTDPLVRIIRSYVHSNGGASQMEMAGLSEQTYYGRNRTPDKYQIGELRKLMLAFDIPKEELLAAVDKALTR